MSSIRTTYMTLCLATLGGVSCSTILPTPLHATADVATYPKPLDVDPLAIDPAPHPRETKAPRRQAQQEDDGHDHARKRALTPQEKIIAAALIVLVAWIVGDHLSHTSHRPLDPNLGAGINANQGKNPTGAPYPNPTTDRQIVANIVHAMFLDPNKFPRTSGRDACVRYCQESFFTIHKRLKKSKNKAPKKYEIEFKAYQVCMHVLEKLGDTPEARKNKLIEDVLKIQWQQYDFSPQTFDPIWKTPHTLPSFDEMVYDTQGKGAGFQLTTHWPSLNAASYVVCGPGFQNKNFGGGYIDGACAYEEWRWHGAPAEAVLSELIKIKALQQAVKLGKGKAYAYTLRKVEERAYIFSNVPMYGRLGHYGGGFGRATLSEIKKKFTFDYPTARRFHVVAAAAPYPPRIRAGDPYTMDHLKAYARESYGAARAQTEYFLKNKNESCMYKEIGNFGAGAFPHDKRLPYLVQLYAYECERQAMGDAGKIRFVLYPFDKHGQGGLKGARKLWQAIQAKAGNAKISLQQFCAHALTCAQEMGKPLRFTAGNGT